MSGFDCHQSVTIMAILNIGLANNHVSDVTDRLKTSNSENIAFCFEISVFQCFDNPSFVYANGLRIETVIDFSTEVLIQKEVFNFFYSSYSNRREKSDDI